MIDGQTIATVFGGFAVLLGTGIGGYKLAKSQARLADSQADATEQQARADVKAKEEQAQENKDNAHAERWKSLFDAVIDRLDRTEKRADDCEEDRLNLWHELRGTQTVVQSVKEEVKVIKQNGNGH